MRQSPPPRVLTILAALVLLFTLISSALADSIDDGIDWEKATPVEIHRHMGQLRAERLQESREAQKMLGQEKAPSGYTDYDVTFYDVALDIDHVAQVIHGAVGIHAKAVTGGLAQVPVSFASGLSIDSIYSSTGNLSYSRSGDVVTVALPATYNAGEEFSFTFAYHGTPVSGGFQGFTFGTHLGAPMISSLSEPYYAHSWWPCKDRPDDKADSFNIAITADTMFSVGSNGTLDSVVYDGGSRETTYYRVRYPMATYLFSVAITVYTVWNDEWVYNNAQDTMPIINFVYPDQYAYSLPRWGIVPDAITAFSSRYGLYPFRNEKYGNANFTWGGGMEHQTLTSMTGTSFGFNQDVVVHELAHQWWGDMITCRDWGDIWLNEGWATYSEALYWEWLGGSTSYHAYMDSIQFFSGGSIFIYDTTSVNSIFGNIVYDKGAWVMHMLRHVLGDSLFFASIDAYYHSQYQYGSATTDDFKNIAENVSGMNLDWFFQEWIYGTYYPFYRWYNRVEVSDSGGYDWYLRINQAQATDPLVFTMPVDMVVNYLGGAVDTLKLQVDARSNIFHFHSAANVANVSFDPDNWILKSAYHQSWTLFLVTPEDELSGATAYLPYIDTIQFRGGSGSVTYSISAGALPPGLTIDNNGIISGTPTDTGNFSFSVKIQDNNFGSYNDSLPYSIYVAKVVAMPGDVNYDNEVNVADLVYLTDYMFRHGPPPLDLDAADVNGTCDIDITDVTYMASFMFRSGQALVYGCVK